MARCSPSPSLVHRQTSAGRSFLGVVRTCGLPTTLLLVVAALAAPVAAGGKPARFRVDRLPTSLAGTWDFHLGNAVPVAAARAAAGWVPIRVPGPWENGPASGYNGHAWYRGRLYIPGKFADRVLGVSFAQIRDVDEVFLNGHPVGQTGSFPPRFEKATLYRRVYPLPRASLIPDAWNEILVHVYNHARYGGIVGDAPRVDLYSRLLAHSHMETYLIIAFAVFFLMIAANHFFLYSQRLSPKANLLFSVFSLATSLYLVTYSPMLGPRLFSYNTIFRFNVVLFPVAVALLLAFLFAFFDVKTPLAVRGLLVFLTAVALYEAVWPDMDRIYLGVAAVQFVSPVIVGAMLWLVARAVARKAPYARTIGVVVLAAVAGGLYDIAADMHIVSRPPVHIGGVIFPVAFTPFYLVMGLVLAHRYAQYYDRSVTDGLTGLMQRHHFMNRLAEEVERTRREDGALVVGMIDLDNFKRINDDYSHHAGDVVLRNVAQRIKQSLRSFDLVGRYGGDELCVAITAKSPEEARSLLERVRSDVASQVVPSDGEELRVTASIGAVICGRGASHFADELIAVADDALHSAKTSGGNTLELRECSQDDGGRPSYRGVIPSQ